MATLENLLSPALVERLGWTLIHFVWQATAIALLLAVMLRVLHRCSASLRYIVVCLALMLIVALPLATMALVEVSEPAAEAGPAPIPTRTVDTTPVEVVEVTELPEMSFDTQPVEIPYVSVPWTQRAATTLEPALPYLVLGWLLGVFGLSTWHLGGWAQLQRMKRRMVCEVAAPLEAKLGDLAAALGIKRAVALLESALVDVPTVIGWIKPVILLPASALSGLSPEQLEAILAHELAHIRRYDYLVNIAQTVIEILGFYHPALWWISHKIRAERENCCDDLAVQVCGDSLRYARALTCLEEMRHHRSELAVAASGGSLVARIGRLLGRPATDNRRFTWLPGLIALLLLAATIIPTALVLAAPEPGPSDAVIPELRDQRKGEAKVGDQSRAQLLIRFILAEVFSDQTLDDETAGQARDLLKRIPTGAAGGASRSNAAPSVEELRQPLREVFSRFTLASGRSEDLIDLLVSKGHAQVLRRPMILQFEHERGSLIDGDAQDPNTPESREAEESWGLNSMNLYVTPDVAETSDTVRMEIDLALRYPTFDREMKRTLTTLAMESTLTIADRQYALLTTTNERRDKDGKMRLFVLLVQPEITLRPSENQPAEQSHALQETEEASKESTRILLDVRTVFVHDNKTLDRDTMRRLRSNLGPTATQTSFDTRNDITTSDFLATHVAKRILPHQTVLTLTDTLYKGGYLREISNPQYLVQAGRYTKVLTYAETHGFPVGPPTASELELAEACAGLSLDIRPDVTDNDEIALRIRVERTDSEHAGGRDVSGRPAGKTIDRLTILRTGECFTFPIDSPATAKLSGRIYVTVTPTIRPESNSSTYDDFGQTEASRVSQAPKQVVLNIILGKFSSDETLDRATAIRVRNLLANAAKDGQFQDPSVEELQRPLWQVLDEYVADAKVPGVFAKALTDLLISTGQVSILGTPDLPMREGKYSRLVFGSDPSPDIATASDRRDQFRVTVEMSPTVQDADTILFSTKISGEHVMSRNLRDNRLMELGSVEMNFEASFRSEYRMLPSLPLVIDWKAADRNEDTSVFLLLVKPTVTGSAPDDTTTEPKTVYVPLNPPDSSVPAGSMSVGSKTATAAVVPPQENARGQSGPRILIETIFADVQADSVLDRQTLRRVGDILEDRSVDLAGRQNLTVGELLRSYVVRRPLAPATMEALVEQLQSEGYLRATARPQIMVRDSKQATIRSVTEEYFARSEDPDASPQPIEAGTIFQATPHLPPQTPDRITLEIAAQWIEPVEEPQASKSELPAVRTTEVASTVTVPRDHYFSFLLEPDRTAGGAAEGAQCKLILFKADRFESTAQPKTTSVPQTEQIASQPRQVLLDVQVVEMEGSNPKDLGIEWGSPQISAGSFGAAGANSLPWGVEIGYTPDRAFTNALQAALRQLRDQGLAQLLSNPQVSALDGRQARLAVTTDERYLLTPEATATDPQPPSELVTVTTGTILSVTPHVGADDEITLEISTEVSNSIPPKQDGELPVVTRRTARNVVTVKDGGTVALAGLSDSQKQLVILVTASLVPESAAPPQPSTASVVLPPREPANVKAPARAQDDRGPVVMSEAPGRLFIHTDADGQVDQEFGFEELIRSDDDRWTVRKPYMDLFGENVHCCIAAERGQFQIETASGQPAPGDATFSGNVVVDITPAGPDGGETCVLYVDELTYDAEKGCLSSSGPARSVCGGTEFIGRGLELYRGPAPTRPAGNRIKAIKGVDLYLGPANAFVVALNNGQPERTEAGAPPQVRMLTEATNNSAPSADEETQITVDFSVLSIPTDRPLTAEAAARLSRLWDQMVARRGTERIRHASLPSAEELQIPARDLFARCAKDGQGDSDALEIMRDLLVSLEYVRVTMNPRVQVVNGQQAEVRSSQHVPDPTAGPGASETVECSTILRVTPHADNTGRLTLDLAVEITDLLPSTSAAERPHVGKYSLIAKVVADKGKTFVLRLEPATEGEAQGSNTLYLLVRPRMVPPEPVAASGTVTAMFVDKDLIKVLTEIGNRTGKRIQVDETVKPQPVAADLETVGFVEVILPRVLENTPYTYRKLGDDAYLVYRPITAKFMGDDLRQALDIVAQKAGVTITCDPHISGEIYAELDRVPLETALRTMLGGSAYVVEKKADYYLVTDRAAPRAGEDTPTAPGYARVSATFVGEDLHRVLEKLAEEAGANLMYDTNISGEVYAELRDVTLEQALNIVLAGSPCVVKKIPNGYAITAREKPAASPSEQAKDAVQVTARFVLVDDALMEALQRELPIKGVTYPEDANALYEIGADIAAGETPLLEGVRVGLLLKAIRSYADSQALAAPRVTVPDGEAATLSLTEKLDYVGGYGEPNDADQEPMPQNKSKTLGLILEVTPHLLKNQDSIRLQFQTEITSLVAMHKALYQSKYEYEVPSFETVNVQTELVVPDGQTALVRGQKLRSLNGSQSGQEEPERSLFILITPVRSSPTPPDSAPPSMGGMRPGAPGMGGFAPGPPPTAPPRFAPAPMR